MNDVNRKGWRIFLSLLAAALLASVWAAVAGSGCGSCEGARSLVGGKTLAFLGVAYYAVLLATAVVRGPSLAVFAGIQVAAGIHGTLLALLVHRGVFCAPCVTAAGAAIAALGLSMRLEPQNIVRTAYLLPGAAFALQAGLLYAGGLSLPNGSPRLPESLLAEAREAPPDPDASARLVVYTRPDCGYCVDLEKYILPKLEREFGKRLAVELRSAKEFPSLPTPTILLSGPGGRRHYPGLPPEAELRAAVTHVMGERRETQALLPESR